MPRIIRDLTGREKKKIKEVLNTSGDGRNIVIKTNQVWILVKILRIKTIICNNDYNKTYEYFCSEGKNDKRKNSEKGAGHLTRLAVTLYWCKQENMKYKLLANPL